LGCILNRHEEGSTYGEVAALCKPVCLTLDVSGSPLEQVHLRMHPIHLGVPTQPIEDLLRELVDPECGFDHAEV
jgi:hypothetical protein